MKLFTNFFGMTVLLTLLLSLDVIKLDSSLQAAEDPMAFVDTVDNTYQVLCGGCHGQKMNSFLDRKWKYGKHRDSIFNSITRGYAEQGMPSFRAALTDAQVYGLTDYILKSVEKEEQYAFAGQEVFSDTFITASFSYELDTIAEGMSSPWGMAFLPDGDMLITDKMGILYRKTADGDMMVIGGVPAVRSKGQGGLMDVELHPNFLENSWIYLSYSKPKKQDGKNMATTAIMRAKLEENSLTEQKDIFIASPYSAKAHHFGSRIEFDREGYLYLSVGDRGNRDENPQDLGNHCGKVHRIHDDGSIPEDNPFVNTEGAMPTIYSYGHRNPQGIAMHPVTGKIWSHEHGPRGGDEINIHVPGKNYGWPVISYGINYDGTTFTNLTEKEGMEQPLDYYVPSIAPCGMAFLTSDKYPDLENSLLVGSLKYEYCELIKFDGEKIVGREKLLEGVGRVRNVRVGLDGYIYIAVEKPGMIFRLMPFGV
ncbi:MAG: PQQ-dependent sugar dehydrogenase [Bacteroidota bacterium]